MSSDYDVAVIGGSIPYQLAKRGKKVIVLEKSVLII